MERRRASGSRVNMETRHSSSWKTLDLFLVLVSLLVLLPCLYYSYVASFPELGFTLSSTDWKVVSAYPCAGLPRPASRSAIRCSRSKGSISSNS